MGYGKISQPKKSNAALETSNVFDENSLVGTWSDICRVQVGVDVMY